MWITGSARGTENVSGDFRDRGAFTLQAYPARQGSPPLYGARPVPHHLRPSTPYAPDALLPGDPGRALALAQQLLTEPRMSNHARGLWGYTGETPDGRALSIQSTGMGGPSAAIVLEELAELGVRRAVRVGTCGALSPELDHGDLVIAAEALTEDGTSRALGAGAVAEADPALSARLAEEAGSAPARIVTTDLFYEAPDQDGSTASGPDEWRARGAVAVEMEAATLFTLGGRLGVATACVLAVSDTFEGNARRRIGDEELAAAAERMGAAAAGALRAQP
jgi:uridine phosphorylase